MKLFSKILGDELRRLGPGRLMLCLVLFLAPWHFKIVTSLPRFFDITQWWAPALFPETLVTVAAAIVSLDAWRHSRRTERMPGRALLAASFTLCVLGLVVGSLVNERDSVYLVRVVVLQYVLPTVVFWLVWRLARTIKDVIVLAGALVAGGGLLFLVATPVYFLSFSHFPPAVPLAWPASRFLYNRRLLALVHNDPRMLYDNVTFGNVSNVSQLLVVLLPLALALALVAGSIRTRALAVMATTLFALHLVLCYSRGPLLVTVVTLIVLGWLVYRHYPKARGATAVALAAWTVLAFGGPDIPRYWMNQLAFSEKSSARERLFYLIEPLGFRDTTPRRPVAEADKRPSPKPAPASPSPNPAPASPSPNPAPPNPAFVERVEAVGAGYKVVTVPADAYIRMALTGLGYGNYGRMIGRLREAGTHNLFLDALVDTGVAGLLGLVGLVFWAGRNVSRYLKSAERANPARTFGMFLAVAFGNMLAVGVLSLYKFEYLGTGTGATLFAFVLAASARLATTSARGERRSGG